VRRPDSIRCAFIVASNDEQVLRSCLLASPDLAAGVETSVQRGFTSAGEAYNRGIAATDGDILVFVHQDVYLPEGWLRKLASVIEWLEARDPNWGVLGVFGSERDRTGRGYLYSTGLRRVLGEDFVGARPVETLDEVVLILRRASGLRFDASLPGFHLYGADICLQAAARGMRSYAMSAFCIHNTNGYRLLPWAYWRCYLRLRRKWWSRLPAQTPCMPMTRWGGPALRYLVRRPVWLLWHGRRIGHRVAHPALVFREVHRAPGGSLALVDERRIR
jgi:glycosyltransferase involved in cell wall biosynthesis